jgi:hypothetical protein
VRTYRYLVARGQIIIVRAMKAAALLLLPCLCSCVFDASGLMCPQSEPTVVTKIAPIAADCPEWPVSLDLHECTWDSTVDPDNCSESGIAHCPGWVVLERVSWDSDGVVRRFTASARPADGGPWCDYRVGFEAAEP